MVESDAVFEVADGVFDLGVVAMVGFEFGGVAVAVGDEGVEVVDGEQGELAAGFGTDAADDEPEGVAGLPGMLVNGR